MIKKIAPIGLIILMAVLLFTIRQCKNKNRQQPDTISAGTGRETASETVNRDRGFDRRISYLEYSRHARCRMECRHISQEEVEDIMQNGKINYRKSELQTARCPRYALEGITKDNQRVRIIFAQCNKKTEVVTVIDLEKEWSCQCPGDDNK
jgi:hypothetical protein